MTKGLKAEWDGVREIIEKEKQKIREEELRQHEEEVREEIEGMKKKIYSNVITKTSLEEMTRITGYNQAIDDVLQTLTNKNHD